MTDLQGQVPWQGPADWIPRLQGQVLSHRLEQFPAVALLGPRQVGKTTLALQLAAGREKPTAASCYSAQPRWS
jgi:predicted AAA+ superfamily ATPase